MPHGRLRTATRMLLMPTNHSEISIFEESYCFRRSWHSLISDHWSDLFLKGIHSLPLWYAAHDKLSHIVPTQDANQFMFSEYASNNWVRGEVRHAHTLSETHRNFIFGSKFGLVLIYTSKDRRMLIHVEYCVNLTNHVTIILFTYLFVLLNFQLVLVCDSSKIKIGRSDTYVKPQPFQVTFFSSHHSIPMFKRGAIMTIMLAIRVIRNSRI